MEPFSGLIHHVVEVRTELGPGELDTGVGDGLDHAFQVQVGGDRHAEAVQGLQRSGLLRESAFCAATLADVPDGADRALELAIAQDGFSSVLDG